MTASAPRSEGQRIGSFCCRFDPGTEDLVYTVPSFWYDIDSLENDIFVMAQMVASDTAEFGSVYRVVVPFQGQLLFCDPSDPSWLDDVRGWHTRLYDFVRTCVQTNYGQFNRLVRLPSMVYKGQPGCEIAPIGNVMKDPPLPQFQGIPQGGYDFSQKAVVVVKLGHFVALFDKPGH